MSQLPISELLAAMSAHPAVFRTLPLDTVIRFFDLASLLKPVLQLHCSVNDPEPLTDLPENVAKFLKSCLGIENEILQGLWTIFRAEVRKMKYDFQLTQRLGNTYIGLFLQHGSANNISEC